MKGKDRIEISNLVSFSAQGATPMPSLQTVTGKSWDKSQPGRSSRPLWANVFSGWRFSYSPFLWGIRWNHQSSGSRLIILTQEKRWKLHETSARRLRRNLQRRPDVHPERWAVWSCARRAQVPTRVNAWNLSFPLLRWTEAPGDCCFCPAVTTVHAHK